MLSMSRNHPSVTYLLLDLTRRRNILKATAMIIYAVRMSRGM